jgi:hypothetical protein
MSFKNHNIPLGMIERYKTSDPFKTYAGKPNYGRQLSMVQPLYDPQVVNNIMRKGFAQADMTAYSQGNVGGKNNYKLISLKNIILLLIFYFLNLKKV